MIRRIALAVLVVAIVAAWWLTPGQIALAPAEQRLRVTLERQWPGRGSPARQAAFSSDGLLLAMSDAAGRVTIRRTADWRPVRQLQVPGGVTSLAFAPTGESLFTAGYDGMVRAWRVGDGTIEKSFKGASGTIWSLDLGRDGQELLTAGEDGTIRSWLLSSGAARSLNGHSGNVWKALYAPSSGTIVSGGFDRTVRIWRVGAEPQVLEGHDQAVVGLDIRLDGLMIASAGDDSTARLWRTADGAPLRTIDAKNHVYDVKFSPDGALLLTAGRARGALGTLWYQLTGIGGARKPVHLWRLKDGAAIAVLPHVDDVMYAAFSPDGRRIVTSSEDGGVRLWRIDRP